MFSTPPMSVAVIGGGAIGSAAAWQLAARGHRVVLVEQFGPGHVRGASHGSSRIFRYSYPSALYIELARRAGRLWRRLERLHGQRFYARTGIGRPRRSGCGAAAGPVVAPGRDRAFRAHPRGGRTAVARPALRRHGAAPSRPGATARRSGGRRAPAVRSRSRAPRSVSTPRRPGFGSVPPGFECCPRPGRSASTRSSCGRRLTCDILESLPTLSRSLPALVTTQEQPAHFAPRQTPVGWPSFLHHPGGQYVGPAVRPGRPGRGEGRRARHRATSPRSTATSGPIRTVCGGCSSTPSNGCPGSIRPWSRPPPACTRPPPTGTSSSTAAGRSPWRPGSPGTASSSRRPSAN